MNHIKQNIKEILDNIPGKPGIYLFYDNTNKVIYIGKAINLKKRVNSYFVGSLKSIKTKYLVSKINDIKYIITDNENDALILENNYIKQFKPKYNILLKDDKTYPWIVVTDEDYPRVFFTRKLNEKYKAIFGPYTSVYETRTLYNLIKKIIPFRTCKYNLSEKSINEGKFNVCLEYHIGNCLAPCVKKQSKDEYNINIDKIIQILNGELKEVEKYLFNQMKNYSKKYEYEKAHEIKEKLDIINKYKANSIVSNIKFSNLDVFVFEIKDNDIFYNYLKILNGSVVFNYFNFFNNVYNDEINNIVSDIINQIREKFKSNSRIVITSHLPSFKYLGLEYVVPKRGEYFEILKFAKKNIDEYISRFESIKASQEIKKIKSKELLVDLKEILSLKKIPHNIHCFDNSNIQGAYAVSSCVAFKDGLPNKKEYRLFKVKTVDGPDDFATMNEVVYRRYKNIINEKNQLPDLIIIDGGKGQLNSAIKALKELNIYDNCDIISIAKKNEEIYTPYSKNPIVIPIDNPISLFIQNIRDEAHRFGITFHRKKRTENSLKSELDLIKGIGDKTKSLLYKEFKTIDKIKNISFDELKNVIGEKKANIVVNFFKKNKN